MVDGRNGKVKDEWFTVEAIDESTFAISEYGHWEQVHAYLLLGTGAAALIDTGIGIGNVRNVVRRLTTLPVKVITTHVHWDHIGGHGLFEEVYVHEAEESWLKNGIPGLPLERIRHDVGRDLTLPLPEDFRLERYVPYRGAPTGLLKDGDEWDLGGRRLVMLHTPGHSPGHLCVHEPDRGYLYAGDLLYKGTLFAFYPSTDPQLFARSVARVAQLKNVVKVLPGHHGLSLDAGFPARVDDACRSLAAEDKVRHGSGVHDFGEFKLHF